MSLAIAVLVCLVFMAVWAAAWRNHPALAFGMFIGVLMGWGAAVMVGDLTLDEIPLWLPPLPFAVVAIALIGFGVAAWFWDSPPEDSGRRH